MRKMYTTKRLLGMTACTALLIAGPAHAQADVEILDQEQPLFESDAPDDDGNQVAVGATGEIELHVKDLEITKVLQLLSIQSQRNIIASRGVDNAMVSADLYGVGFEDALTAILEPNGFGFVEEGNFIYVLTREEIAERNEVDRRLVTKIHRLDYLRADEAAGFVTPMLSENGTITASGNVEGGISPGLDNAGADRYSGPPTLVIRDYEDQVDQVVDVLEQLDVEPKQVIIEATVLRATLTENNQFGVDFSLFADLAGATSPLNAIGGLTGTREGAITSQQGFDSNSSTKLGFLAGDAAIFVSALDDVTDTTLIATPKVTVLDRNSTSILVGEKIAYLSTTVTETSQTQTVEFLEVGTQLNVRPFVASDGKVRLELRPSVSDAELREVGTDEIQVPDESTAELTTNVIVESGQTIVLGGLFVDDTVIGRRQVPGLGSIPFLGKAFQGQNDTVRRSEVIFMVKATVDESSNLSRKLGKEAEDRVGTARVAARPSLLPWSRGNLTTAHLVNARKSFDEAKSLQGVAREEKMKKARYHVDMALHLNPSMVDALRLKEEITGESAYIKYDGSIINDTYKSVLEEEMKALGIPDLPAAAQPQSDAGEQVTDPASDEQADASDETSEEAEAQADAGAEVTQATEQATAADELATAESTPASEQAEPATAEAVETTETAAAETETGEPTFLDLVTAELLNDEPVEAAPEQGETPADEQADANDETVIEIQVETVEESGTDNTTVQAETQTE